MCLYEWQQQSYSEPEYTDVTREVSSLEEQGTLFQAEVFATLQIAAKLDVKNGLLT